MVEAAQPAAPSQSSAPAGVSGAGSPAAPAPAAPTILDHTGGQGGPPAEGAAPAAKPAEGAAPTEPVEYTEAEQTAATPEVKARMERINAAIKKAAAPALKPAEVKKVEAKTDLKVPDGSKVTAARLDEIVADAKARGLSLEQAQGLVDQEHKAVEAFTATENAKFKTISDGWVAELKADPEFGGENFNKNAELSKRAIQHFAPEGLVKILNETGLGNNPMLVRAWANVGKAMAEDKFIGGGAPPAAKDVVETFYGPGRGKDYPTPAGTNP